MSKGEEQIEGILKKYPISYKREVIIDGVQRKKSLRFDFGIYNNNRLIALIEIQGAQHYIQVKQFQPKYSDFTKQQEYDRIKIASCLARSIPLYIIPYSDLEKISTLNDIFQDKYKAKTKWHNDLNNPYK